MEHLLIEIGERPPSRLCEHPRAEEIAVSLVAAGYRVEEHHDPDELCEDCVVIMLAALVSA